MHVDHNIVKCEISQSFHWVIESTIYKINMTQKTVTFPDISVKLHYEYFISM